MGAEEVNQDVVAVDARDTDRTALTVLLMRQNRTRFKRKLLLQEAPPQQQQRRRRRHEHDGAK